MCFLFFISEQPPVGCNRIFTLCYDMSKDEYSTRQSPKGVSGFSGMEWWTGMMDWNGVSFHWVIMDQCSYLHTCTYTSASCPFITLIRTLIYIDWILNCCHFFIFRHNGGHNFPFDSRQLYPSQEHYLVMRLHSVVNQTTLWSGLWDYQTAYPVECRASLVALHIRHLYYSDLVYIR